MFESQDGESQGGFLHNSTDWLLRVIKPFVFLCIGSTGTKHTGISKKH